VESSLSLGQIGVRPASEGQVLDTYSFSVVVMPLAAAAGC
jgi:hypothetical protein